MGKQVIRYSEPSDLWKDTATITREVWPEYNLHSEDPNGYWDRLFDVGRPACCRRRLDCQLGRARAPDIKAPP
jgi:hypothetical protein